VSITTITVSKDSKGVFWVSKGSEKREISTLSYHYEGAMMIAEKEFKNAGGEGKAIIIDRVKK
jgi:hypothetical protein